MKFKLIPCLLAFACGNTVKRPAMEDNARHRTVVAVQTVAVAPKDTTDTEELTKGILDSAIHTMSLFDNNSVVRELGILDSIIQWNDCECATIYNRDTTERLELHHANGGHKNDFDVFSVSFPKAGIKSDKFLISRFHHFQTENNIHLGMTEAAFLAVFKNKIFKKEKAGQETVYIFENGYETYLASYRFRKGYLGAFRFGYDNS